MMLYHLYSYKNILIITNLQVMTNKIKETASTLKQPLFEEKNN